MLLTPSTKKHVYPDSDSKCNSQPTTECSLCSIRFVSAIQTFVLAEKIGWNLTPEHSTRNQGTESSVLSVKAISHLTLLL